eukprot:CAMPEP_0194395266 /NCGR_PEP_ID=MMETSP0174-20130528/124327_1 /TAXON_ID=216777 /ORGANISM="Proboscia alata, Strain PI-D3" /LENGTH=1494 /DNA_ID=CAMNT_0039191181 /DNA_START=338 /DNA_END=4822 /DNA_ORIENTATION=-
MDNISLVPGGGKKKKKVRHRPTGIKRKPIRTAAPKQQLLQPKKTEVPVNAAAIPSETAESSSSSSNEQRPQQSRKHPIDEQKRPLPPLEERKNSSATTTNDDNNQTLLAKNMNVNVNDDEVESDDEVVFVRMVAGNSSPGIVKTEKNVTTAAKDTEKQLTKTNPAKKKSDGLSSPILTELSTLMDAADNHTHDSTMVVTQDFSQLSTSTTAKIYTRSSSPIEILDLVDSDDDEEEDDEEEHRNAKAVPIETYSQMFSSTMDILGDGGAYSAASTTITPHNDWNVSVPLDVEEPPPSPSPHNDIDETRTMDNNAVPMEVHSNDAAIASTTRANTNDADLVALQQQDPRLTTAQHEQLQPYAHSFAPPPNVATPAPAGTYAHSFAPPPVPQAAPAPAGTYTHSFAPMPQAAPAPAGTYTHSFAPPAIPQAAPPPAGTYTHSFAPPPMPITAPAPAGTYTHSFAPPMPQAAPAPAGTYTHSFAPPAATEMRIMPMDVPSMDPMMVAPPMIVPPSQSTVDNTVPLLTNAPMNHDMPVMTIPHTTTMANVILPIPTPTNETSVTTDATTARLAAKVADESQKSQSLLLGGANRKPISKGTKKRVLPQKGKKKKAVSSKTTAAVAKKPKVSTAAAASIANDASKTQKDAINSSEKPTNDEAIVEKSASQASEPSPKKRVRAPLFWAAVSKVAALEGVTESTDGTADANPTPTVKPAPQSMPERDTDEDSDSQAAALLKTLNDQETSNTAVITQEDAAPAPITIAFTAPTKQKKLIRKGLGIPLKRKGMGIPLKRKGVGIHEDSDSQAAALLKTLNDQETSNTAVITQEDADVNVPAAVTTAFTAPTKQKKPLVKRKGLALPKRKGMGIPLKRKGAGIPLNQKGIPKRPKTAASTADPTSDATADAAAAENADPNGDTTQNPPVPATPKKPPSILKGTKRKAGKIKTGILKNQKKAPLRNKLLKKKKGTAIRIGGTTTPNVDVSKDANKENSKEDTNQDEEVDDFAKTFAANKTATPDKTTKSKRASPRAATKASAKASKERRLTIRGKKGKTKGKGKSKKKQSETDDDTTTTLTRAEQKAVDDAELLSKLLPNLPPKKEGHVTLMSFCDHRAKKKDKQERGKNGTQKVMNSFGDIIETEGNANESRSDLLKRRRKERRDRQRRDETEANTAANAATEGDGGGPQVEVINGEIVVRESSLSVQGVGSVQHQSTEDVDREMSGGVVIEEETMLLTATYQSYLPPQKTFPRIVWSPDETKLFYTALRQCGTDFSMICSFFTDPVRNRKEVKSKYKYEQRRNSVLIDMAMNPRAAKSLDLEVFKITQEQIEEMPATETVEEAAASTALIVIDEEEREREKENNPDEYTKAGKKRKRAKSKKQKEKDARDAALAAGAAAAGGFELGAALTSVVIEEGDEPIEPVKQKVSALTWFDDNPEESAEINNAEPSSDEPVVNNNDPEDGDEQTATLGLMGKSSNKKKNKSRLKPRARPAKKAVGKVRVNV